MMGFFVWSFDPTISKNRISKRAPVGGTTKRLVDLFGAFAGLLLLSPLIFMVAVAIKLSDRGPVFFGHMRIGRDGRTFHCLKFRTMTTDGDAVLANYFRENPVAKAEWETTRKLKFDPRVTRIGHILRKLSIDELPQLINILRGDMSIVGPRPVVQDELKFYGRSVSFYLRARPGLTGLWQISGRNDVGYQRRVAFDRYYVENWSFFEDIFIILKTIPAVCLARGSY